MRKNICNTFALLLTVSTMFFLLPGCLKDHITKTYVISRPVYTPKLTVLASINGDPAQPISAAGKIYIKDQYIFLNDIDKGIHVYDNSNPAHPVQTAFLNIPGNEDIAIKGNMLYADMYGDLLTLDISDLHHAALRSIQHMVFPMRTYLNGSMTILNGSLVDSSQVITGWISKDTTVASSDPGDDRLVYFPGGIMYAAAAYSSSAATGTGDATGVAGSMAKMVLINDYIYAITQTSSLGVISIKDAANPALSTTVPVGAGLETIYPFQDKLFLGSSLGVYMYDLSNPGSPARTGAFIHGRSCDPVITDGNYVYITLHAGTSCGGPNNELDVVDITQLTATGTGKVYPLTSPHGLCKDGNLLFVCDDFVNVYDASDGLNLKLLTTIAVKGGYDVMAGDHHLMVVTDQGLYQYSYDDNHQFSQISFLPVIKG
ncbi:MAG TPA: hypothetical protein VK563_23880 [Puia sp.]|nr:hypothetical protein [Puia sp.]